MANNPISMSKLRHLLRLHSQGCSKLQIAAQTGIARNTLKKYLEAFSQCPFSYAQLIALSDPELEDLFVKPQEKPLSTKLKTLFSLFPQIEKELKRKGMSRLLLWENYKKDHPDGLGRSQFNHYLSQWRAQVNPVMHMEHKVGDKLYIDFAGDKLSIVDRESGEIPLGEMFSRSNINSLRLKPILPAAFRPGVTRV